MLASSLIGDFERAVGQYLLYRFMLKHRDSPRELFLAMPVETYDSVQEVSALIEFIAEE